MNGPLGDRVPLTTGLASLAVASLTMQAFTGLVGPIAGADRDPDAERAGIAVAFLIAASAGLLAWSATDSTIPAAVGIGLALGVAGAYGGHRGLAQTGEPAASPNGSQLHPTEPGEL